jgi:hypothetical protein
MTWVCCMAAFGARAQFPVSGIVQRYQAEAGLLAITGDLFAAVLHPAGPVRMEVFAAGIQSERLGWPGAPAFASLALVVPTSSGNLSVSMGHTGLDGFAALQGSLGYARPLAEWLSGGIRVNHYRVSAKGYGARTAWPVDLGLVIRLSDKLSSDLACWNILGTRLSGPPETRLARSVRSGLSYHLSDQAGIAVSVLGEEGSPVSCQVSVFYRFHSRLAFRMAYVSAQQGISFCGYYDIRKIRFSVGFGYLFPLGSMGLVGLQYSGHQKDQP